MTRPQASTSSVQRSYGCRRAGTRGLDMATASASRTPARRCVRVAAERDHANRPPRATTASSGASVPWWTSRTRPLPARTRSAWRKSSSEAGDVEGPGGHRPVPQRVVDVGQHLERLRLLDHHGQLGEVGVDHRVGVAAPEELGRLGGVRGPSGSECSDPSTRSSGPEARTRARPLRRASAGSPSSTPSGPSARQAVPAALDVGEVALDGERTGGEGAVAAVAAPGARVELPSDTSSACGRRAR